MINEENHEVNEKSKTQGGIMRSLLAFLVVTAVVSVTVYNVYELRTVLFGSNKEAQIHANQGVDLFEKGDFDGAIAELRIAVRLDPDKAAFHAYLGDPLLMKGDLDEAISEYRTALRQGRDSVHLGLGTA